MICKFIAKNTGVVCSAAAAAAVNANTYAVAANTA